MSVILDTSHSPIGPCGPLEQSPFGDSLRHASTALLSCTFDSDKNAAGAKSIRGIVNRAGSKGGAQCAGQGVCECVTGTGTAVGVTGSTVQGTCTVRLSALKVIGDSYLCTHNSPLQGCSDMLIMTIRNKIQDKRVCAY